VDVVENLTARLMSYLGVHAPDRDLRRRDRTGACVVLTAWESAYRGGQVPRHSPAA